MSIFDDQIRADARRQQDRENRAREAVAFGMMISNGQGPIEWEEAIDFGLTFVRVPFVSVGHVVDADQIRDDLGLADNATAPLPQVTGMVIEWDRDERGFYTGAWVGARVDFPLQPNTDGTVNLVVPATYDVQVQHMFRFEAVAMKDVPVVLPDP